MENPKRPDHDGSAPLLKLALVFSGLGFMFAVCIVLGYIAGGWLADHFGLSPVWKGLGAIAGIFVGVMNTILLVKRFLGGTR